MEYDLGDGRRLDVYATKENRRIGVEIALNSNIDFRKTLASLKSVSHLYLVCRSKQTQVEVETWCDRILYPNVRNKVQVPLLNQFLKNQ
jgi:hypothetical protein